MTLAPGLSWHQQAPACARCRIGVPKCVNRPTLMAHAHGALNIAGGLWPLLHVRSFERFFGPKTDRWLEYTVAGLLTSIGYAQWRAGTPGDWRHARRLGVATAGTLLLIDLVYVPQGRIRRTYLIDAAAEAALILGWLLISVTDDDAA
jgi:hypothetical protein